VASIKRTCCRTFQYIAPLLATGLVLGALHRSTEPEVAAQAPDTKSRPKTVDEKIAEIGIQTVTEFHKRLEHICVLPGLEVYYDGPLARPRGVGGVARDGRLADATSWSVCDKPSRESLATVLFRLSISLDDKPGCVGVCTINRTKLYLYVSDIAKDGKVDDKVLPDVDAPSVSNLTIRELVKKIADK